MRISFFLLLRFGFFLIHAYIIHGKFRHHGFRNRARFNQANNQKSQNMAKIKHSKLFGQLDRGPIIIQTRKRVC